MSSQISRRTALAFPFAHLLGETSPSIRRELFMSSPGRGVAVMAYAFYTEQRGGSMVSLEERWSRSDTVDNAFVRRSRDDGENWGPAERVLTGKKRSAGTFRRHPRAGFVDARGRYIEFWNAGILATDDPLEGLRNWNVYYRVSKDGGRSFGRTRQIIHIGSDFHQRHPLPGVWTGKNCVMMGDVSCVPIDGPDGSILVPVQITPLGDDGKLANPGGGYTYTDAAVLRGRWRAGRIEWQLSELVRADPSRSTRGMDEGTLGILSGGRILMVLRGSNDRRPELPGYRWHSISSDAGQTWTPPQPWTYSNGERFFSPSSCSQLIRHTSGRLFWVGNIVPENPRGNRPRYPLLIGEVDRRSGLLQESSLRIIDTLQPAEDPLLSLSNFYVREDRRTGGLAIHMTRLFAGSGPWSGDAFLYRVQV